MILHVLAGVLLGVALRTLFDELRGTPLWLRPPADHTDVGDFVRDSIQEQLDAGETLILPPIPAGWDADSVLVTLAEIESL